MDFGDSAFRSDPLKQENLRLPQSIRVKVREVAKDLDISLSAAYRMLVEISLTSSGLAAAKRSHAASR